MPVPNENHEIQVVLTSTDQVIPTGFTFLEADYLQVTKTVSGVDTPLVEGADYDVILPLKLGLDGSILMTPGTIGDIITIRREPPCTQLRVYVENASFPAKVTERALDQITMIACLALDSFNDRSLRYPLTEFGTNNVTPILSDRKAEGNGTIAGFDGATGAITIFSKGSLGLNLLLSNDSLMTSPDMVNGYTGSAIKIRMDLQDLLTRIGAGLNADGTYNTPSGSAFIDLATSIHSATLLLDAQVLLNQTNIALNTLNVNALAVVVGDIPLIDEVVTQGAVSTAATGGDTVLGTVSLILPPGATWKRIYLYTTLIVADGSGNKWFRVRSNTVIQTINGTNITANETINASASDTSTSINHTATFVPSNTGINQTIETYWTWGSKQNSSAVYAVGVYTT